ncbi:MAG: heme ABC transporter ATP-binding protein [Rhodospirillaceae bacterium TMED140]|nr:heme ABC transporter ATP-binding protein [Rhodospirillaceae bacterium]OUX70584.1 MAG: heme ABC transporter ATP-binding protein [Rhodospirillaceae bacterium TMED140]
MREIAIELSGISKSFGPVQANKEINLSVESGTIHGIVGENGAGKSTLMSILYGFYMPDEGSMRVFGEPLDFNSSEKAIEAGIGMVHQHFMLGEPFTVLENIILGAEGGFMLSGAMRHARETLLDLSERYGLTVNPDAVISSLPVGVQQRVEILKALYRGAKVLILDEPTGVLTPQEADALFDILRSLKEQGTTILLITHKLHEIMDVTDRVSVIRRGEMVGHREIAQTSPEELAEMMVGRKVLLEVDKTPAQPRGTALSVSGLNLVDDRGVQRLTNVSFEVKAGEIFGVAGVSGNGQAQLLEVLSGMEAPTSGTITIGGEPLGRTPNEVRLQSMGHVPEDRQHMGLVTAFPAWESGILGFQASALYCDRGAMKTGLIKEEMGRLMEKFDVRPPNPLLGTAKFSGGNQQKIVLAREIDKAPDVLLVGQPTRGVDIGAIEFIHRQIIAMRDAGTAILLVSVELEEVLSLSDRVVAMFDGYCSDAHVTADMDERSLGLLMAGEFDRTQTGGMAA